MKTVMMTHHGLCGGLNPGSASPPPAGSGTAASSGAPAAKACRASSRSTKGQSKPVFTPNAPGTGLASSKPAKAPPKAPAPPPAKAAAKAGGADSGSSRTPCSSSEGEDTVKTPDRQARHRAGHPRPWSKSGDPQKRPSNARDSRRQQADGSAGMLAAVRALDAELEHGFGLAAHARSSRAAGDGCADLMPLDNAPSNKRHKRRKRNPYVDDEASASGSGGSSGGEGGYDTSGAIDAIGGSSGGEDGYGTSGAIDAIDDYFDG